MDKYKKGKNVEEPLEKNQLPIKDLPEDFIWMHVNAGTKMRNVLDYAIKEMQTHSAVVWTGSGPAVGKVVSCVEIMKRKFELHQVNKISFRKVKEYWDPILEDLDPLVVVRDIPTIHILLSKNPVDSSQPGYQGPLNSENQRRRVDPRQQSKPQRRRIETDKFESFGLRSSRTKNSRWKAHDYKTNSRPEQSTSQENRDKNCSARMKNTDQLDKKDIVNSVQSEV